METTGTALETVCYACGATGVLADGARCACGEPVWLATDASGFAWPGTDRDGGPAPWTPAGMWRYADLLPVDRPTGVGAAAGGTPLVRARRLDEYAGCRTVLKDESQQPTGSFKDRGSAVGVAHAAAAGREWVGTVSHGNMATSVAAHAAGAGLDCVVLVPADVPDRRVADVARYGPTVLRVRGDYGRLYRDSLAAGPEAGVSFVNSDAPLRVAGQKTVALEICEAFAPGAPEALVLPVSSGGLASATWKGLRELRAAGILDGLPRLYLVQSAACDPIARAYRSGADRVTPLPEPGETIAYSIANPDPPSGTRALAAVRATGGAVVSVDDGAVREARRLLARRAGVCAEASSAVALAGTRTLAADGELDADDEVAVVVTGTGFREDPDVDADAARTVDREAVPAALAALTGRGDDGP